VWIWVAQAILGYEWLISGLNKILDRHFDTQLLVVLQQSAQGGPYGWYAWFIRNVVLPNHALIGMLTQIGETSIGVVLLFGAGVSLFLPSGQVARYAKLAAASVLLGSIFLSLNYFFQSGVPIPWLNSANSLAEGVDITILIALFSMALLAANLHALATPTAVSAPITRIGIHVENQDISA